MRWALVSLVFTLILSSGAQAQSREDTLADIRQELSVLYVELQKLNRELNTTEGVSDVAVGGTVIDRVAAIEQALQRLTSQTEELEFRINRVVSDGSNRIGDLEFRLCELESGCDIATLGQGTTLGNLDQSNTVTTVIGSNNSGEDDSPQLAIGEKADFDAAIASLEAGSYATAAAQFEAFLVNYPGSPLASDVGLKVGEAYEGAGETAKAARSYLDIFSRDPNGPLASEALFRLGRSLAALGQIEEACVTLGEVSFRFPGSQPAVSASAEMQRLGCS